MADTNLFETREATEAAMGGYASSDHLIVRGHGFNTCTGLFVIAKNAGGNPEATLFHLDTGPITESQKAWLQEINLREGKKLGVFITTVHSTTNGKKDPEAAYYADRVKQLVKGIDLSPTVKHTGDGMAVAYRNGLLQVRDSATHAIAEHTPFSAILPSLGEKQGQRK